MKSEKFLTPIHPVPPPPHTQLKPQCFICKHFPVCNIREDYLKTAQLIQNIIGAPCDSYILNPPPCSEIKDFEGIFIENDKDYFPETIKSTKGNEGKFYQAKFVDENNIAFIYIFSKCYMLFKAIYDEESSSFKISKGKDIFYEIECTIEEENLDLQLALLELREDIIANKEKPEEKDVINTTFFSAALNCKFYEWEKGLDYNDGIKRLIAQYPCGIPIGKNGELYHLATYHIEPNKVPYYHPENGQPVFAPMPYPVYIPPKCHHQNECCRPYKTREELNDF